MTRYFVTVRTPQGRDVTQDFDALLSAQLWILGLKDLGCTVVKEWVA